MKRIPLITRVCSGVVLLAATAALAQEPTYMDAATHPGAGQFYSRLLFSHSEYDEEEKDIELNAAILKLSYGIRATLACVLEAELASLSNDGDEEAGLNSTTFRVKYRLFKRDLGPLNTWRTSLLGGLTIPGNIDDSPTDDTYPRASAATTAILGRHGLNAELEWQEYGDEADRVAVNGSYLYRLVPSEYTVATRGAWYSMLESLNEFTDEGDSRADVALGLLYEARRWAWEISLRVPLAQDWPQEADFGLTMGVRLLP